MRKILCAIVLAVAMVMSNMTVLAATDAYKTSNSTAVSLVTALGIMEDTEENPYTPDSEYTKGEFAKAIMKLLQYNITPSDKVSEYYTNLDCSTEEGAAVEYLTMMEIIPAESDTYDVTEGITYIEAMRITINAIGYAQIAEVNGGYPGGYVKTATSLKLSKDLSGTSNSYVLKQSDVASLIYNALLTDAMDVTYEGNNPQYTQSTYTWLEKNWDVYQTTGVVYGCGKTTLSAGISLNDDDVNIGGTVMHIGGTDIYDYIGYTLKVFYKSDYDDGETVVAFNDYNTTVTIVDSDDLEVSGNDVDQIVNGKAKDIKIDTNPAVIYNGRYLDGYTSLEEILPTKDRNKEGRVKFIANEGSSKVNVIVIEDYLHLLVDRIDRRSNRIYAANENETLGVPNMVELDYDNMDVKMYMDGKEITLDDIAVNDVVSLMMSSDEENVRIYVSRTTVTGLLSALLPDDKEVTIAGTNYDVSAYATDDLEVGTEGTFALSTNGKVVGTVSAVGSSLKYGYLKSVSVDTAEERLVAKIFAWDGTTTKYYSAESTIVINGQKLMYDIAAQQFTKSELITFKVDDDGMLTQMNRPYDVSSNPDYYSSNFFIKNWNKSSVRYTNGIIGRSLVNEETLIFYVPRFDRDRNSDYRIMTMSDMKNRVYSDVTCYDVDRQGNVGVLVIKEDVTETVDMGNSLFFISGKAKGYDDELGEETVIFKGFEDGEEKELTFTSETSSVTYEDGWVNYSDNKDFDKAYDTGDYFNGLNIGDALQYSLNGSGQVGAYRLVYNNRQSTWLGGQPDYDDKKNYFEDWSETGSVTKLDFYDDLYIGLGDVQLKYNDYIVILALNQEDRAKYSNSNINIIDYYRPINLQDAAIYEYNPIKDTLELGDMESVQKSDTVFVRSKKMGEKNEVMVYVDK